MGFFFFWKEGLGTISTLLQFISLAGSLFLKMPMKDTTGYPANYYFPHSSLAEPYFRGCSFSHKLGDGGTSISSKE